MTFMHRMAPPAPGRRAKASWRAAGLVIAAGLLTACAELPADPDEGAAPVGRAEAASREVAPAEEHADTCSGLEVDHLVRLSWEGLAAGAPLRGRTPVLAVTSQAEAPLVARLSARFYTDQGPVRADLGEVKLPPGGAARVSVPLDPPGVAPSRLEFAAQVLIEAELWRGDQRLAGEGADALYFHPDPATGELLAYGEVDYQRTFGAGDFRGLRPRAPGEAPLAGVGRARRIEAAEMTGDPEDGRGGR